MAIRRRKIYYVPGLISLLLLALIFVGQVHRSRKDKIYHIMPLLSLSRDYIKQHPNLFRGDYPPKRIYEDIHLSGNPASDAIKLAYLQIRIREILQQNDSVRGIHIHLSESSKYGTFIKTLNILQIEAADIYMVEDNNIWFSHVPPVPVTFERYPCSVYNEVIHVAPDVTFLESISIKVKEIWKRACIFITGFCILLVMALWNFKQQFQQDNSSRQDI